MLESSKKNYLKNFNFWTFVILLILSILSYTFKGNLRMDVVQGISSIILYPVEKTITFTKNIFYVYRKNIELSREIATISLEIQRCANIKKENRILRELYGYKPMNDFYLIPCEIIGKSPGLHNRSIIIDGGLEDGIEKNMPVVSTRGLVGKIIETTQKTSELLTLYNRNSFISAVDLRSRVQGIVNWQGGRFLILEDVPLHSDIKVEDTLLTSGMGGVFPKGIFIGKVIKVEESPKEIVMKIGIEPFVNFSLLEDVFVLTESMTSPLMEIITPDTSNAIMVQLDIFETIKNPQNFGSSLLNNLMTQ
ncbi:MAG: rod shape-determining protein MreC [Candidatus Cloacimonadota bacterium]|nr:MAG: rod shape-determining protein MreC [Candidatus Cloacimonadota bacterium]